MLKYFLRFSMLILLCVSSLSVTGCTFVFQKGRDVNVDKISRLRKKLTILQQAKKDLEINLKNEIKNKHVVVQELEGRLVITFLGDVLFDSGKSKLIESSTHKLAKVAEVLNSTVKSLKVGVEGHTDNVPIKYSQWGSNWDLSTARALSVLHFLVDQQNVNPQRLSASGYGEYVPIVSNETKEGRQKNRRVEIVILPNISTKGR